jgi:GntR family transcriptional regulator/MocR family aminotransferase
VIGSLARSISACDPWTTLAAALHLDLDPAGSRHDALERAIRAAIRGGRLPPGTRLPSTRVMASELGLARGTVVEAYEQLRAEGYLGAQRGAGTWVAELAPAPPGVAATVAGPARPPRFSFHPGLPDLTAFPHAAWTGALRRGLRDAPAASLGYGDPRGRPELRTALAGYLARARGVVADPELIVVCAGFSHGLSLLSRVLVAQGRDRVAMEDPCLSDHREVAHAARMRVLPLTADARGARTDLLAATGADAAVLGPAHQFPLGAALHPERRAAAVAWARATGGLLVEDDYDAELRYDRQPVGALQALDPEHVVYAGTASKTLAPALRLGWLVLPPALLEPLTALRAREDVQPSAMDQIAFAELLASGAFDHHVRRMRTRYRRRRDRLVAMLAERAPAVTPVGISAGLRVLLQLPRGALPAEELARRAAARSVELFPVGRYHHDGRAVRDGVVAGYAALPEHDFEAGIAALGDLLTV